MLNQNPENQAYGRVLLLLLLTAGFAKGQQEVSVQAQLEVIREIRKQQIKNLRVKKANKLEKLEKKNNKNFKKQNQHSKQTGKTILPSQLS